MEKTIEWEARVGKKIILGRLKHPRRFLILLTALVVLFILIFELALSLEEGISAPRGATFIAALLILALIAVYAYKTNIVLFREGTRHYKIDSQGVTVDGEPYPWARYRYFQDDSKLMENVSGILPFAVPKQKADRWLIQLLVDKGSDKGKLILVIDKEELYQKVREALKEKLEESSTLS